MLTVIPFAGFYNTIHESNIDDAIQQMFTDRDTGCTRNEGLEMRVHETCDFKQVFGEYAKAYAEAFADEFGITGLTYDAVESPRKYNFETDRIFVDIPESTLICMYNDVDKEALSETAKGMFTSYDGFISSYSNDVESWGEFETWDHNQRYCLIVAMVGEDFDIWKQNDLMEYAQGNGEYDSWISNATPNISRLYNIHDYLETRAKRKE